MKNLKTFLLFLCFFTIQIGTLYAFNMTQEEPEPIQIGAVALAGVISILLSSLVEAANHIMAGTFVVKVWWVSTARPAVWTFVVYAALAVIDIYVPFLDSIIEGIFSIQTDAGDTAALVAISYVVFPIVKALFTRQRTKEKVMNMSLEEKIRKYRN